MKANDACRMTKLEGMTKPEGRGPKAERSPKSEGRMALLPSNSRLAQWGAHSDFGFRPSGFLRASAFDLRASSFLEASSFFIGGRARERSPFFKTGPDQPVFSEDPRALSPCRNGLAGRNAARATASGAPVIA